MGNPNELLPLTNGVILDYTISFERMEATFHIQTYTEEAVKGRKEKNLLVGGIKTLWLKLDPDEPIRCDNFFINPQAPIIREVTNYDKDLDLELKDSKGEVGSEFHFKITEWDWRE